MTKYIVRWRTNTSECEEICCTKDAALRLAERVKWEAVDGVTITPTDKHGAGQ